MKTIITFVLFQFISITAYCCQCNQLNIDSLQKVSYRSSDFIFLGEVEYVDTINKVSILNIFEIYKGNINLKKVYVKNVHSCNFLPYDKGLWIVYSKFINDSTIEVNTCGASRSNLCPYKISSYNLPPPPRNNQEISKIKFEMEFLSLKLEAILEWNNELYKLRNGLMK